MLILNFDSILLLILTFLFSCTNKEITGTENDTIVSENTDESIEMNDHLNANNKVKDIVDHPAFAGFGELLLPWDNNSAYHNIKLDNVGTLMPYHSHVNPGDVIEAINYMIDEANSGRTIFYDFYTNEQKELNPDKEHTGLFFFRGNPGAPFAIICPGGGFSYIGSLHEGFPLALEISRKGYNALVIRYRIGSGRWATEDLAAAITYIMENAQDLGVGTHDYSLWGGSAGARMVGDIAQNGVNAYGGGNLPKPVSAVIAYTGQSSFSNDFPPTFITVAANDRIVNINTVEKRVQNLENSGVEVEYHRYETAGHGFGLGTDTDAEGWLDLAVQFWERHINQ